MEKEWGEMGSAILSCIRTGKLVCQHCIQGWLWLNLRQEKKFPLLWGQTAPMGLLESRSPYEVAQTQKELSSREPLCTVQEWRWICLLCPGPTPHSQPVCPWGDLIPPSSTSPDPCTGRVWQGHTYMSSATQRLDAVSMACELLCQPSHTQGSANMLYSTFAILHIKMHC